MNHSVGLILLPFLMLASCAAVRRDEVDSYLKAQMEKNHIPGLSVAITRNGKIVKLKGYGLANLEWEQPVTSETSFQLASSTKLFTGIALMLLVEDGKLALNDRIAQYITEAPSAWQNITVRHLATHSAGIPDDAAARADTTVREYVQAVAALPLSHRPGERSDYGIAGYLVLSRILEVVSGQTVPDVLKTRLVNRLGLTSTQFDFATDQDGIRSSNVIKKRAGIYNWTDGKFRNFSFPFPERSYSAGGLLSSAADLANLAIALDTGSLLSRQSLEQMWRQDRLANGALNQFGIGWVIKKYNGHRTVGHSGGPALSDILRFPEEKLTISVLTNGQNLYPYLAQGVADFFIPPPPLQAQKAIEDNDPKTTQMLKEVLLDAAQDKVNGALFTSEAQKQFVPAFKSFGLPFFKSLDAMQSFNLIEQKEDEKSITRRYQAVYGKKALIWNFRLSKDGKIMSLEPIPE